MDIPFVGRPSLVLGKQLINLAHHIDPKIKLQPITRPPPATKTFFPRKDPIPKQLQSRLVYKVQCKDCPASYIGKTIRQAARRLPEHGAPSLLPTTYIPTQHDVYPDNAPMESTGLRRSDRIKNKKNLQQPEATHPTETIQQQQQKGKSAILNHQTSLHHTIDWEGWTIIAKEAHPYRLLVRESLAIAEQKPELNKTVNSVPLIIYPDGMTGRKPKRKRKQINPPPWEGE